MKLSAALHCLLLSLPLPAIAGEQCRIQDPELVSCSVPAAPKATELKGGYVVLQFLVFPDGSVGDVEVRESGGDARWKLAAMEAVSGWRYIERESSVAKVQRFDFGLSSTDGDGI